MSKSLTLFVSAGGIIVGGVGAFHFAKPATNLTGIPPLLWFLLATLMLAAAAYRSSKWFCLAASTGATMCAVAAAGTVFAHYTAVSQWQSDEEKLKQIRPLDLPHLAINGPAPDIDASDLSGQKMKLSDYRGKVVLLVFWATWCGPCMGAIPHEKELVERFAGRPFALVGVNGDSSIERALAAVERHKIPWRSFWNGKGGGDGPIVTQWGVQAWPTVYLIDDEGIIRHNDLHKDALNGPLERLVKIAEARTRPK